MTRGRPWMWSLGAVALCAAALALSPRAQFVVGGALVNFGYRMQDHLHAFDLTHHHDITPQQILHALEQQNVLASSVRSELPRSTEHPKVALLVCMDARIDTSELVGDTRRYYYVVRTAGSVLGAEEQEMLELAVRNGVKLVVLTTHTDCAAEKVAADPTKRDTFPALTSLVAQRETRIAEFLARPYIKQRIAEGELLVKRMVVDTATERLLPAPPSLDTVSVAKQ